MNKTILIIEDDAEINDMLTLLLRKNGYCAVNAYSGTEALLVYNDDIDLVLLDLMLPGKSGDEIIKELKARRSVPIIVMSAIHDVGKKVDLFALGADDYITKPFDNAELLARIAARLRQSSGVTGSDIITYKNIQLDRITMTASCAGKELPLARLEFELLKLLLENPKRTCTKSFIYDRAWDYENSADDNTLNDNTLNVHISKLRKKLRECNPDSDYIETVWGVGYRLKK